MGDPLDNYDEQEQDVPLGRAHEEDIGDELYEPPEQLDKVERATRQTDYEPLRGRVRVGGDNELDLSRVDLDSLGRSHGGGDGADWEANMAPSGQGGGHTAMDGTGFYSDTRGSSSYTGGHEGIDPNLHREMRDAGLRLGLNSVDTNSAAFALANSAFIRSRENWRTTEPWQRRKIYAARKVKRANREWAEVREDSIHRHFQKVFKGFLRDRSAADPYWEFCDPADIERWDGVDSRSARSLSLNWRWDQDEKNLQAMSLRYASLVEGIKTDSVRARLKKKPHLRDLALFVLVQDLLACGVLSPMGFDLEELLSDAGGELVEMRSAVSERERREFIINSSHEYLAKGSLFPPYCWEPINPVLEAVVGLLQEAEIELLAPEPEIDWSTV